MVTGDDIMFGYKQVVLIRLRSPLCQTNDCMKDINTWALKNSVKWFDRIKLDIKKKNQKISNEDLMKNRNSFKSSLIYYWFSTNRIIAVQIYQSEWITRNWAALLRPLLILVPPHDIAYVLLNLYEFPSCREQPELGTGNKTLCI